VSLVNGADACNIFWQVGSSATLGTGTTFQGNILALTSITLDTGATIEDGRALARNGAVTLDTNVITRSVCAAIPTPSPAPTAAPTATPAPAPPAPTGTPAAASAPVALPDTSTAGAVDAPFSVVGASILAGLLVLVAVVLVESIRGEGAGGPRRDLARR
jgi:hypothetical protein